MQAGQDRTDHNLDFLVLLLLRKIERMSGFVSHLSPSFNQAWLEPSFAS